MKEQGGVKSGLSYRKPLGQKEPRGEVQGQRPAKAPEPKKG